MADPIPPKKTKGQQKIEVKPMDDAKKRSVTFTKRRAGLFKKADQLCALTGAEVALMVISPGGKPFTFGSPAVDAVIARYKSRRRWISRNLRLGKSWNSWRTRISEQRN
ncbi:agamous-like MADS-box protein AGL62 [Neltuma alba]|uniref:agamous-like MADS-box protein AGL62 n=1 Tax=Neltuma alba TaxID=207710 RepID=UPI0010A3857C|nr:agamous-like MADS-box protein AGL62 [Prosopis alba]